MQVLASTLAAYDKVMAELATEINSTVPNVPQSVSDELQSMVTVTQSGLADLQNKVSVPLEYADAYRHLEEAATAMWTRVQATLYGVGAIREAGTVATGFSYFDQGRYARDEFQAAFKQYQLALTAARTISTVASNDGPASRFFWGLSGDGYAAYKMYAVQEGATTVVIVGVRVVIDKESRTTYEAVYNRATTLAKQYGVAISEGQRLRVVLVEATTEQKELESKDISITSGER